jgi:hypothetical protein
MNLIKITVVGLLLGSTFALADDCANPPAPTIPDGAGATMDQMIAGQKAVKAFQASNIEYMACLEPGINTAGEQLASASGDAKAAAKEAYAEKEAAYNAAVSAEESVAGDFNVAIRAYKTANPK